MLGLSFFDAGTDRAVERLGFVFFGVASLFVFGVNKRALAVLASEDFVWHRYILHVIKTRLCGGYFLMEEVFF